MKAVMVNIIMNKDLTKSIMDDLFALGIRQVFTEVGRSSLLDKNIGLHSVFNRSALIDYPVEILGLVMEDKDEAAVLSYIARKYDLKSPGKGTIYSHHIEILNQHQDYRIEQEIHYQHVHNEFFFQHLVGIVCVVQRGEGDKISRIALNYGASVPAITHGEGSGVRDKLGLLRITIPPEKELIKLVLSKHDTNPVMELYIAEGKLDEPGRGIAYVYPIKQGIVNTKISRSRTDQAASIEQMVSAIDALKGGMEWRKSRLEREGNRRREYLANLSELNLICSEGRGTALTEAAMSSGAPGATICKIRHSVLDDHLEMQPSIREQCKMIVPTSLVPAISKAVEETGCFENDDSAMLYSLPVEKAFTYRARQIKKSHR